MPRRWDVSAIWNVHEPHGDGRQLLHGRGARDDVSGWGMPVPTGHSDALHRWQWEFDLRGLDERSEQLRRMQHGVRLSRRGRAPRVRDERLSVEDAASAHFWRVMARTLAITSLTLNGLVT